MAKVFEFEGGWDVPEKRSNPDFEGFNDRDVFDDVFAPLRSLQLSQFLIFNIHRLTAASCVFQRFVFRHAGLFPYSLMPVCSPIL